MKTSQNTSPAAKAQGGRRPAAPQDLRLSPEGEALIASIPADQRPLRLAERYPRIVNHMSQIWHRRAEVERYLTELMIDHRGDRQGFAYDIVLELMSLREHFDSIQEGRPGPLDIPGFIQTPTLPRRSR